MRPLSWLVLAGLGCMLLSDGASAQQRDFSALVRQLADPDPSVSGAAWDQLKAATDPAAFEALLAGVARGIEPARSLSIQALEKFKDRRKLAVFIAMAQRGDLDVSVSYQIGPLGQWAVGPLVASVGSCDGSRPADRRPDDYQFWVARSLEAVGRPALSPLLAAARSTDPCRRAVAYSALDGLAFNESFDENSKDRRAFRAIIAGLSDRNAYARWSAVQALDSLSQGRGRYAAPELEYKQAAPALRKMLASTSDPNQRERVTLLLERVAPSTAPVRPPEAETTLADPDPAARAKAAAETPDRCETNCSATLLPLLRDRDEAVRAATVVALEKLNDTSQNRVVDPAAVSALMEIAGDPSPAIRGDVIRVLGNIADARSAAVILAALSDVASEVRVAATLALPNFDVPLARITDLSRDRDPAVVSAAVEALADRCEQESVPVLIQALENEKTAGHAVRGLGCIAGMTKDPRAIEALLDRFARATGELGGLREAAAKTGDPRAIPLIARQLTSTDSYTRRYAVDALGELRHKDTVPILSRALKDPSNDVRVSAAFGLAKLTDFPATPELVAALTDIDDAVRRWAPAALVRSHDPAAIDPLIRSIRTNVGTVIALGDLPDPRVIAALREYLAELPANAWPRQIVIETLAKLGVVVER